MVRFGWAPERRAPIFRVVEAGAAAPSEEGAQ
jgi:hypothetical protein